MDACIIAAELIPPRWRWQNPYFISTFVVCWLFFSGMKPLLLGIVAIATTMRQILSHTGDFWARWCYCLIMSRSMLEVCVCIEQSDWMWFVRFDLSKCSVNFHTVGSLCCLRIWLVEAIDNKYLNSTLLMFNNYNMFYN